MKIIEYVRQLKSNFELKGIKEDLSTTRDELSNATIPVIEDIEKKLGQLNESNAKSETYALYFRALQSAQSSRNIRGNIFTPVLLRLRNARDILDFAEVYLDNNLNEDVTSAALSLRSANVMQLLNVIAFFSRYTRRLADVILRAETAKAMDEKADELQGMTQAELNYLSDYRVSYVAAIDMLALPAKEVERLVENIPEITVSEVRSESALAVHGRDKVDPLRFGLVESKADPFWLWALNRAEYQAERYHTAKYEKEMLELRIARYKRNYEKNPDPKLASTIEKREAELDLRRAKLAKMEKRK